MLITIDQALRECPAAGFAIEGCVLASQVRSRLGIEVCERVRQPLDGVDSLVKRADLN